LGSDEATYALSTANDDILHMRVSDKALVREVSQDRHTHISYAEDEEGLMPRDLRQTA